MLPILNICWILLQATTTPVISDTAKTEPTFTWEVAATVLGVAALIIGAIVKIFADNKKVKENPEVLTHVNQLTTTVNQLNDKLTDQNSRIVALETDVKNAYREIEELKELVRDVEKDNFNALGKVVDKVDSIKDLLINLKTKK